MSHWNFLDFSLMGTLLPSSASSPSASPLLRRRRQSNNASIPSIPLLEYHPHHSLLQLIRERDWYGVRLRLEQPHNMQQRECDTSSHNSKEATTSTTTPLHAACLYRAPPDVIVRLIQADPSALTTPDPEGWIPLHVHLLYHTSTPLLMIAAGGVAAANRHLRFGGAALHLACRHGASLAVLQALVELAPQQIATPTQSGTFAAHMLLRSTVNVQRPEGGGSHDATAANEGNKEERMEKLLVLIRAWVQYKTNDKKRKITTHVRVADVIRFQVACAPGADVVGEFLSSGYYHQHRTPGVEDAHSLHVAAAAPFTYCDPIPPVLHAFSSSATIRPYPLHIALRRRPGRALLLLDACPAALEERDAMTRLFPFQLAAAYTATEETDETTTTTAALETVYTLLRRAPHVLSRQG